MPGWMVNLLSLCVATPERTLTWPLPAGTLNYVKLTDLKPDTTYYYVYGDVVRTPVFPERAHL